MKNNCIFIKILIFLQIFLILVYTPCSSFANSTEIDTDISSDNFTEFRLNRELSGVNNMAAPITKVIAEIVRKVLSILRLFSGYVLILSIAIFGLYRVLAANPELTRDIGISNIDPKNSKVLMDAGRVIVIGAILVFSSTSIVEFVMNLFL